MIQIQRMRRAAIRRCPLHHAAIRHHEAPNLVALKRLKLKDGTQELLHATVKAHQFDPTFSPDGRYHCFALSATSPQLVLVIQDLTEKTETTFRPRDGRAVARSPSIAPDGRRIVFSLSDVGGHRIASVDLRGQDLKTLAASPGMNNAPAFSPDSAWVTGETLYISGGVH